MKDYFLWRHRVLLTGAALLLFSAHMIWTGVRQDQRAGRAVSPIMDLMRPVQVAAARLAEGASGITGDYMDLVGVQRENRRLEAQLASEQSEEARLNELEAENQHLSELLDLKQMLDYKTVAANVIGADASGLSHTLVLEGGADDGFTPGMAVISPQGVVGRIITTSANASRVLLIDDHNSAFDALDQRTRVRGIISGVVDGGVVMKYVDRSDDVKSGDTIVTSGLDGIFPRGMLVGNVTGVEDQGSGLFFYITVDPAADFSRLEQVMIITQRINPPPDVAPKG